ncbi:MAG TPA: hypothetical protein VF170_17670 [Planctomycetaceae bacterium]
MIVRTSSCAESKYLSCHSNIWSETTAKAQEYLSDLQRHRAALLRSSALSNRGGSSSAGSQSSESSQQDSRTAREYLRSPSSGRMDDRR